MANATCYLVVLGNHIGSDAKWKKKIQEGGGLMRCQSSLKKILLLRWEDIGFNASIPMCIITFY